MPEQLTFESSSNSSFLPVAVELIERFCGVRLIPFRSDDRSRPVQVYHGPDAKRPCRLRIPYVEAYDESHVPGLPESFASKPGGLAAPFPFDLFSAVRFWLADEGNASADPNRDLDRHGRLLGEHCAQHRTGCREIPIVNAYLTLFTRWVKERFGIQLPDPLPPGKRCAVILSHDVDDPVDPGLWKFLWLAARHLRHRPLRVARYACSLMSWAAKRPLRSKRDRHWLFEEIMKAEDRWGFRSTFFFSVMPSFARGASWHDVEYDVHQERFAPVFRKLLAEGWEIGLHTSYNAHRSHRRIADEKRALEEVVGAPVVGNRHHYWHMKRPFWATLQDHARAGLQYDSSVAFNETPGYRLGVAFPCHLWDPATGERIPTLQIPLATMDGAYFYRPNQRVEQVLKHFDGLLQDLKRYWGVASIDWHVRASYPASRQYELWGEAYLEILRLLAADPEVLVQPCGQAAASGSPHRWANDSVSRPATSGDSPQ